MSRAHVSWTDKQRAARLTSRPVASTGSRDLTDPVDPPTLLYGTPPKARSLEEILAQCLTCITTETTPCPSPGSTSFASTTELDEDDNQHEDSYSYERGDIAQYVAEPYKPKHGAVYLFQGC